MGLLGRLTSYFLVFVFCASGAMKLTDRLSPGTHQFMKGEFVHFAKVHPFTVYFDYHVEPMLYMKVIGWVELVCGLILLSSPRPLKVLSSLICMVIMIGAVFTLYKLNKPLPEMTPAMVTFGLLLVNMLLMFQGKEEDAKKID